MKKYPTLQLTDFDKFPFTARGPRLTAEDRASRRAMDAKIKKGIPMIALNIPNTKNTFNISEAYNEIAGAAFLGVDKGHTNLWIYLKDGELKLHYTELKPMSDYFVCHYPCKKITFGFTSFEWNRLGRMLARVHFKHS